MSNLVLMKCDGSSALITLNRPQKLNAWTADMRATLIEYLTRVANDDSIASVVLTGAGRAFCAGQDLAETSTINNDDHEASERWIDGFEQLYRAIRRIDKPVIAAVNGVAAGSGFQYALLADLRIGHLGVRMGQPEILSGIPSITGIWTMWPILGRAKTAELVLTGELVEAAEAERLGLLTSVVAERDVLGRSLEIARRLGDLPRGAFASTKNRLREIEESTFVDAFASARRVHAAAYRSGEPQLEMERFLQSRSARGTVG